LPYFLFANVPGTVVRLSVGCPADGTFTVNMGIISV
jgi:hypothetical protein